MGDNNIFKIIIIDDNKSIHLDFISILTTKPVSDLDKLNSELFAVTNTPTNLPQFEIDFASQGQEGVSLIKEAFAKGKQYALAFVDIRMPPGWDGIETIKHIWEIDKSIQVVICTAYSDYSWDDTVAHLGKTDNLLILKKPFDNVSVRQLACALTKKWQLAEESRNNTNRLKQLVEDKTASLQESLSLVKSTFESSTDGILVLTNDGMINDYNQHMIGLLHIPQEILDSKSQEIFLDYLKDELVNSSDFVAAIQQATIPLDDVKISVVEFKNGNIYECYSQPHKLDDKLIGRILNFRDITKRAKMEQELLYQATHDALTGLANRVKLFQNMKIAIKSSEQNHSQFATAFIDFDRFKLINDSLSHLIGDELLKMMANRLQSAISAEDTIARLGGDEFVIIFMNINNQENIELKVRQLGELFQQPFDVSDRQVTLTASIGISIFPNDGNSPDILLRNADAAMYQAKALKGNNFKFYNPELNIKSLAVLDQEMELRQAIINNEFFLCYQPQVDAKSEKLVAVEALLRWKHPVKGVLLPMDFVPLAEEIGLIVAIGEWAIRTACMQNKSWQDKGLPHIRVAVNVSSQQFNYNLIETVKNILDETGLKPSDLELELTENCILSNREIINMVAQLKELGVLIAIDDFGTGYSSLSYLHKIPLDRLKIDKSFIQNITSATDDEVIIRAVIAMAKSLNLEVLAEGVETIDQLNFLKTNQCGDIQGFYFSKPLNNSEIEMYLSGLLAKPLATEEETL